MTVMSASHHLLLGNFCSSGLTAIHSRIRISDAFAARLSDYAKLFMNVGRAEPPDGSFSSIRMNHHGIGSRCFVKTLYLVRSAASMQLAGGGLSANAVDMNHCFKKKRDRLGLHGFQ